MNKGTREKWMIFLKYFEFLHLVRNFIFSWQIYAHKNRKNFKCDFRNRTEREREKKIAKQRTCDENGIAYDKLIAYIIRLALKKSRMKNEKHVCYCHLRFNQRYWRVGNIVTHNRTAFNVENKMNNLHRSCNECLCLYMLWCYRINDPHFLLIFCDHLIIVMWNTNCNNVFNFFFLLFYNCGTRIVVFNRTKQNTMTSYVGQVYLRCVAYFICFFFLSFFLENRTQRNTTKSPRHVVVWLIE